MHILLKDLLIENFEETTYSKDFRQSIKGHEHKFINRKYFRELKSLINGETEIKDKNKIAEKLDGWFNTLMRREGARQIGTAVLEMADNEGKGLLAFAMLNGGPEVQKVILDWMQSLNAKPEFKDNVFIKEIEENSPLSIQFYCDMDGVLVDLDKGFKKESGGLTPKEYEAKNGKNTFWRVVNKNPTFWLDLDPLPDAAILWDFIKDNFKNPPAVILSAGQGDRIREQKTQWIRTHIDPTVQVLISPSGVKKPEFIINNPNTKTTHLLLDDTDKNIMAWENSGPNRLAILHKNAADSINKIKQILL